MSSLGNLLADALHSIRRNSLMSIVSVFSVVCALLVVGMILTISINVNFMTEQVEDNLEIKVYLLDSLASSQRDIIETRLRGDERVESVAYESKAQALASFRETLGEGAYLLDGYTEETSPIPDSFIVSIKNSTDIYELAAYADSLEGVRDAVYGAETVEALLSFNRLMRIVSLVVVAIMSVIAVFMIYNTIKLTVFSRSDDIVSMKYIGATNFYICAPFVIEGTILGLLGAAAAVLVIRNIYFCVLGSMIGENVILPLGFTLAPASIVLGEVVIAFLVIGTLLGSLGSMLSVRKYLNV